MSDDNVCSSSYGSGYPRSKHSVRAAQTNADVGLQAAFEETREGESFDYFLTVEASRQADSCNLPTKAVIEYLEGMQRGGLIQPFGCMIAVQESSFTVIAYSENAPVMLDLVPQSFACVGPQEILDIGIDARTLITPASAEDLKKAATAADISLSNPLTVRCKSSEKALYAILHRIEVGLVMDLEPFNPMDATGSFSSALHSYKLVAKAISRLQSLPGGDIGHLCDAVVEEVRELTGYDRVMAYRFHEDEHGEIIAEIRRSDLEPYIGLHYPATDVPQAARFLFMKNRVRMITDCSANFVKIIQDNNLKQALSLVGSTLRAPHRCHAQYMTNTGSMASLVMAVTVNDKCKDDQLKGRSLWGLVVCHHTSPRAVAFPLRTACEFLMQVLGMQLNLAVELGALVKEKHALSIQTLLFEMLFRDAPIGLMSKSPNVMDLVKCDGAALYYGGRFWLLGVTPTESQIKDIADWLLECHRDSTGFSTDNLAEAGYPHAAVLGDAVCGMVAAKITEKDFLFWFRSHTAKEVRWGGAQHDGQDEEDGRTMNPRSSFKAFLEVVKRKSPPWEEIELDAIHSLQLMLRGSFQQIDESETKTTTLAHLNESKLQGLDELSAVTYELARLIETATAPIFAVDSSGFINGWNAKVAELTGLSVTKAMGQSLVKDIVLYESFHTVARLLHLALIGEEKQNVEIKLKTFGDRKKEKAAVILIVNSCSSRVSADVVVGVCFIGQDVTTQKIVMDKFTRIQADYKAIVQNPNPLIPPIFGADELGRCSEWNPSMENLSGWKRDEVLGRMLVGEIFGTQNMFCRLKGDDELTKFLLLLNNALDGQDIQKFPFGFYSRQGKYVEVLLTVTQRTVEKGKVTGVCCFLHIASPELQRAIDIGKASEKVVVTKLKELAYVRQQMKNPLYGIMFARNLLEGTNLSDNQKRYLETSSLCERQLQKILDDSDLDSIEDGYLELEAYKFRLGSMIDVVTSQGMIACRGKNIQLICETPQEVKRMCLFGDQVRLQQILSDFLSNVIRFTPFEGCVVVKVTPTRKRVSNGADSMRLEFRVTHSGTGLPQELVQEMFERVGWSTQEGLGLSLSRKIAKLMKGDVHYIREMDKNCCLVTVELPLAQWNDAASTSNTPP